MDKKCVGKVSYDKARQIACNRGDMRMMMVTVVVVVTCLFLAKKPWTISNTSWWRGFLPHAKFPESEVMRRNGNFYTEMFSQVLVH